MEKIMNFSQLDEITKSSVKQAIKEIYSQILEEKEQTAQNKTSSQIDDLNLRAKKRAASTDEEEEEKIVVKSTEDVTSKEKPEIVVPKKLPEVLEVESIIKSINVIRSGNSLKDPGVQERFQIYFDKLNPAEKIALKGFLDGIAQVIAGDVPGEDAVSPSSSPYNVSMKDKPLQRNSSEKTSIKSAPGRDGVPGAPIVVGESANKIWVTNVFSKNEN
jgi:hypothetical protein